MKEVRILFFLYYFPPIQGTAAKRNFRIAKALAHRANSTSIFTASRREERFVFSHNTNLVTIPAWDYRSYLRRRTKDGAIPEITKKNALAQWLIRFVNSFPVNIIAGEGGLAYYFNLLSKGQQLMRNEKITHLYSSFRPFTDHYAAYKLKKRNPQLFWIADFRDLVLDPHYEHIFFQEAHQDFFKRMFGKADLITTVSDGLANKLRAFNANVLTVRNGIEAEYEQADPGPSPFFTITYTGSMFLDKRNAEPLFMAILELIQETKMEGHEIQILYAGKDGQMWKRLSRQFRFESIFTDKGIVTADEAKELQNKSCINLLLTVSSDQLSGVLTGKMIEYFEAGCPVLGIVVHQNDPELHRILHELEAGESFSDQPRDLEGIKEFIFREYRHWKATGMNRKAVNTEILKRKYAQEVTMEPLFEQIFIT